MNALIIALAVMLASPLALAEDLSKIKQQLDALQQSVRTLQQATIDKGVKVAESLGSVEQMRRDFQTLQGNMDAINFKLQNLQDSVNRYQQDSDARLKSVEERLEILDKQPASAVPAAAGASSATADEGTLYQKGLAQVRDGNYAQAATTFNSFAQKYPKSTLAGSAQYWVGECYYAQKDFQRAIKEYQAYIERYPRGDKVGTAQLKQGLSFADLGMKSEAILFLQKLIKDRPNTPEAKKAQDRINQLQGAAPVKPSQDNIPMAPGAVKSQTSWAPLPQNTSPLVDRSK